MEALLYFALWAGLIFLMMRLGCGAHVMGHRSNPSRVRDESGRPGDSEIRWVPPKKDMDPVCGEVVATDKAKPSVFGGNVYYFCSRECREVFEANPVFYTSAARASDPELGHSHA